MAAVFPIGETYHRNHSPKTPRSPLCLVEHKANWVVRQVVKAKRIVG
ncbi:hypothetical protein HanXRQr2_Chr07g0305851 [Helianthus annuus]|uniref:Uncharacterized protein n=1 Tax=Helianthus annuus TaxID=4232 RepID=A0A9K3IN05_HELAN|nr:hypothetical protein HanXRQr2_Chr07g0305851 [Helianthus annuus]KAJ0905623.1 hypothetical protein HanPSC8_Chr07g0296061 [Helianthus annuus]